MLTPIMFEELAEDLAQTNGLVPDVAGNYMALIGDTPELDDQGKLVVRDKDDAELARLTVPASWDLTIPG
jgi:hypothetical protein